MTEAPLFSTFYTIALIPIGVLIIYALLSGLKKLKGHKLVGPIVVIWDLVNVLGYMIFRRLGESVGSTRTDDILAIIIVHASVATIVMILEICVLTTGLIKLKRGKRLIWHGRLGKTLFVFWWMAFVTGQFVYLYLYVL